MAVSHPCGRQLIFFPLKGPHPTRLDEDVWPILLTPVLSKMAAKHGGERLTKHMEDIVDQHQFGSLSRYSTVHAITELYHSWLQALEKPGTATRIFLLDFRKAFDRVDHHILLTKDYQHWSSGLCDEVDHVVCVSTNQRVKAGKVMSEWVQIKLVV